MSRISQLLVLALGIGLLVVGMNRSAATSAAAGTPKLFSQAPCVDQGSYCSKFESGDVMDDIRTFQFTLPSAGKASVSFTGSIQCGAASLDSQVVDLFGQIVTGPAATANGNGPGGLRFGQTLPGYDNAIVGSDSFNLAATRVVAYASGGKKQVWFKLHRLRQDQYVSCILYDMAFSVLFVP